MSDALRGGYWVTRGLIKVWTGPRDAEEEDLGLTGEHLAQQRAIKSLMAILAHNFDRIAPIDQAVAGVVCHCGCLLVNAAETCPACLVWAELDAARSSWRATPYRPTRMESAA